MPRPVAAAALLALASCVPATQLCEPNDPTSTRQCYATSSPVEAAVITAEAATLWVVAGGCKSAGCAPHLYCNPETELCEPHRCGDGQPCPQGSKCDFSRGKCQQQ